MVFKFNGIAHTSIGGLQVRSQYLCINEVQTRIQEIQIFAPDCVAAENWAENFMRRGFYDLLTSARSIARTIGDYED